MSQPKLYRDLAAWWPLLSAPEEYAEEAAFHEQLLLEACARPPRTCQRDGATTRSGIRRISLRRIASSVTCSCTT